MRLLHLSQIDHPTAPQIGRDFGCTLRLKKACSTCLFLALYFLYRHLAQRVVASRNKNIVFSQCNCLDYHGSFLISVRDVVSRRNWKDYVNTWALRGRVTGHARWQVNRIRKQPPRSSTVNVAGFKPVLCTSAYCEMSFVPFAISQFIICLFAQSHCPKTEKAHFQLSMISGREHSVGGMRTVLIREAMNL